MPTLSDYYSRLGVAEDASREEIRKAYNIKVLQCHPDKVAGKEEDFRQLHEAFEVLSNPEKCNNYIQPNFTGYDAFLSHFKRDNLFFQLITNPFRLNHYTYYNKVFDLTLSECLIPGEVVHDRDRCWEKLSYVGHMIMLNLQALEANHPKPSREIKERIRITKLNEKKLGHVIAVLLSPRHKFLYDISLEINHSEEMQEIERLVGGYESIKLLLRVDPALRSEGAISALKKANLLSPINFKYLILRENKDFKISQVIANLPDDLVTQSNFNKLLHHNNNIRIISRALPPLMRRKILNQVFLDIIFKGGKNGETIGNNLGWLKDLGILTQETIEMVVFGKLNGIKISKQLNDIYEERTLTSAHSEMLLWSGNPKLSTLNSSINKMFVYGVFLLSCDLDKGKKSMFLALELKSQLKNFSEMAPLERATLKEQFSKDFLNKLHSLDNVMAIHRKEWKIILANVFIAATGIGLVFIAINRSMLFSKTNRQKQVEKIDKEFGNLHVRETTPNGV